METIQHFLSRECPIVDEHISVISKMINNPENEEHFEKERCALYPRQQSWHIRIVEHLDEEHWEQVEHDLYSVADQELDSEESARKHSEEADEQKRVHGYVKT